MKSTTYSYLVYFPAVIWSLIILQLSIGPSSDFPPYLILGFLPFDKAGHFAAYFLLTLLITLPLFAQYKLAESRYLKAIFSILLVFLYGLIIELLQGFVIMDRNLDFYDLLANSVGSLVGFAAANLIANR